MPPILRRKCRVSRDLDRRLLSLTGLPFYAPPDFLTHILSGRKVTNVPLTLSFTPNESGRVSPDAESRVEAVMRAICATQVPGLSGPRPPPSISAPFRPCTYGHGRIDWPRQAGWEYGRKHRLPRIKTNVKGGSRTKR